MDTVGPIRVFVVDDHVLVREGLCALIGSWPEFTVVGEASNGLEAVSEVPRLHPDVVLMDLVMPGMGGVEAISAILQENPDMHILVLSSFSDEEQVSQAIQAGAIGYLLKESSSHDLIEAIFDAHLGKLVLHPAITRKILQRLRQPADVTPVQQLLTPREIDVLKLVAQGLSNQGIAQSLCLSEWTVTKHVSSLLSKLGLENRTQAALYALRTGVAELAGT
ncbi:MAG: response regulator transcription factor [Anaerolineae bacterium]|nr:response regulator transcription factor [Anaerolineae bacterium]